MFVSFVVFATALMLAFICCLILRRPLARVGMIDKPNHRSSHTAPTLRGGGIGIGIAVALGTWIFHSSVSSKAQEGLLTGALAVFLVSLADDWRPLASRWRLATHFTAAMVFVAVLAGSELEAGITPARWGFMAFSVLAIVGYTNAFNFMDGINGLAASQAVLTGLGTSFVAAQVEAGGAHVWIAAMALIVAGAAAGFLPHNFPRPRMFMGDVGSATLGFLLAGLGVSLALVYGSWLIIPVGLLHANFVLDTGITLLRRAVRGERWYEAHREHFYQRLVRAGHSHSFVTKAEIIIQAASVVLVGIYCSASAYTRCVIALAIVTMWGAFFLFAEHEFARKKSSAPNARGSASIL